MLAGIASNRVNALRLAFATIGISAFIFIYFTAPDLFSSVSLPQFSAFTLSEEEIPNIVHFAHLIRPDNVTGIREIKFQFKHFVAIYSAHYHLNPSTIYIHTDATPATISKVKSSEDKYTRIIANLPNVIFNHEVIGDVTPKGFEIVSLAAKSDFLRTRVMRRWGGIYLDTDAYVIRDLGPLRRAGFKNVVGRQIDKKVACGTFLSVPGSDLVTAYNMLQPLIYNGEWTPHSVDLMTSLAHDFSALDNEVLILEQEAFFPGGWGLEDLEKMYKVNMAEEQSVGNEIPPPDSSGGLRTHIEDYVEAFELKRREGWEYDWRQSYVIHGWGSGHYGESFEKNFGKFKGITPEYVLSRTSNFGRAVYQAVAHAANEGIIDVDTKRVEG